MTRARGSRPVSPRLKVWVVFHDRVKFGDGRAAPRSDRAARLAQARRHGDGHVLPGRVGYLRELEEAAGFKFLERMRGAGPRSGARLTSEAKQFLDRVHGASVFTTQR